MTNDTPSAAAGRGQLLRAAILIAGTPAPLAVITTALHSGATRRPDGHRATRAERPGTAVYATPPEWCMAVPPSDPAVRRLRAQVASSTRWSREDPRDPNGPLPRARAAFDARFYEGIPDDVPAEERERRAAQARKAYFAGLSLKSLMARKRRAGEQGGDAA